MFRGGLDVNFGFVLGVFGDLQIIQGNGSVVVEAFGAIELLVGQYFVGEGFAIVRVGAGDVGALHAQQDLAFLHRIAQPRANFNDTPSGNGNHRHGAGNIRAHNSGRPLRLGALYSVAATNGN